MVLDFFNTDKEYYSGFESFCYQNCLRLVLEANNIPNALLYINSSLGLIIDIKPNEGEFVFSQPKNARNLLPVFSDNVKRYYCNTDDDVIEIFAQNIKRIEEQFSPIIVGVDVFYLPYTPYYQKNHAKHTLVLCGYSEVNDLVYIVDWYEPWFFKGTIPLQDFFLARNSDCPNDGSIYSGSQILNNWAEIDITQWCKTSVEDLLIMTFKLTLDQYFCAEGKDTGLNALNNLVDNIEAVSYSLCESVLKVFKDLHGKMYIALKRHKLFRQYIEIAQSYISNDSLSELILLLDNIIDRWDTILALFLKASFVNSNKTRNKIIINMKTVIGEETQLGNKILKLYNEFVITQLSQLKSPNKPLI
ncbi:MULTISPECIES: BtrH N-terminal domain-containing protein [Paenibacillus]|uniref:BtrH N-terminal domain-containing protein n=1 Tax=Paenibacillus TaxID=44249 RepID=UPI00096F2BBA|nr:BtrH N-terminal domain-containing protein [Paenibacillus odorifer]OMD17294.1 hypothetical protein BJP50_16230 [Paenibacillus odorifer]